MKKIYLILFINLIAFLELSAQLPAIYGDNRDNIPTVTKTFGKGIYVASYETVGGLPYAVFTKFDVSTGLIKWEKRLPTSAQITDFDYNSTTDEVIVVGHTQFIHDGTDNKSFWGVFNGVSGAATYKLIDNPGSEYFNRILRHPNTNFYILGSRNPTATPSSNDVVTLYELDGICYRDSGQRL